MKVLLHILVISLLVSAEAASQMLPPIVFPNPQEETKLPPPPAAAKLPEGAKSAKVAAIRAVQGFGETFAPMPVVWGIMPINWPRRPEGMGMMFSEFSFNELGTDALAKLPTEELNLRQRRLNWTRRQLFEMGEDQAILDRTITAQVKNPDGLTTVAGKTYAYDQQVEVPAACAVLTRMGERNGQYLVKVAYQKYYDGRGFIERENFTGLLFFMPIAEFNRLRADYRDFLAALSSEEANLSKAMGIASDNKRNEQEEIRKMIR